MGGDGKKLGSQGEAEKSAARARGASKDSNGEPERERPRQTAGNFAVQRLLRSGAAQTKREVSEPGDAGERQADRLADAVLGAQGPAPLGTASPAGGTDDEREVKEALGSEGQPLDAAARSFFEPRFGTDLGGVRVHTGTDADASARELDALAYTVGRDIVFGAGQYDSGSEAGRRLLAHELAHVVGVGGGDAAVRRKPDPKAPPEEVGGTPLEPGVVPVPDPADPTAPQAKYPWQYEQMREKMYPRREASLSFFLRVNAEIDVEKGVLPVQDVKAEEITAERQKLEVKKKAVDESLKADKQNKDLADKKEDIERELSYLPDLKNGQLPKNPAVLDRVKRRWTAYSYSKKKEGGEDLTHDEMVGRVLDLFDADPDYSRFPQWLRYMVLHFSGMRYLSAHGSYAPVTELVRRLKTEEVKRTVEGATEKELDDFALKAETELKEESKTATRKRAGVVKQRLADLDAVESTVKGAFSKKGDEAKLRAFEEIQGLELMRERISNSGQLDDEAAADIDRQIAEKAKIIGGPRLAAVRSSIKAAKERRRQALLQQEIERAQKALATLDDTQALAMLRKMREQGAFPDWFWRQVVRRTALRLESGDPDWEKESAEETAAQSSKGPVTKRWMSILNTWKGDATAWREKHGGDLSLVVSHAVCNEISEQAQHARGVDPAGGIGQKAAWYSAGSKAGRTFSRVEKLEDLKPGSTLFFATWSRQAPTDNVQKIRANLTPDLRNEFNETIKDGMKDANGCIYHLQGDELVTRKCPIGSVADPSMTPPTETQWLIWFHEATVVETDKNRGRVMTFETGPAGLRTRQLFDDPSTNKDVYVVNRWNVYVGYTPPGKMREEIAPYLKDILPGR